MGRRPARHRRAQAEHLQLRSLLVQADVKGRGGQSVAEADRNLYAAKGAGRDQVIASDLRR